MKKLSISFFCIFLSIISISQEKTKISSFSNDVPVFLDQLDKLLNVNNKSLSRVFKQFEESINNNSSDTVIIKRIINICDKMLQKRLRPNPHFYNLLMVINQFNFQNQSINNFSSWLNVVEKMIDESTVKRLMQYFKFTENFISTSTLRSSRAVSWNCPNEKYIFMFENGNPFIFFPDKFTLSCSSKGATIYIYDTKGRFWPISNKWEGLGGYITWEKLGFSKDSVYAQLDEYKIDLTEDYIKAESVLLYNKKIFTKPIPGTIKHKIDIRGYNKKASYPYFRSNVKNVVINNIFPDVDYIGGYILKGSEFIADGGDYAEAKVILKRDNKPIIIANANRFSIQKDKISSQLSAVKLFFDNDSIYHSALKFTYKDSERKLELYRKRNGISESPLINTYHQITMDCEFLEWNIDQDIIFFGSLPGTSSSELYIESVNHFLEAKYQQLQRADKIHPLILIRNYINDRGEERFFVDDFAKYAGYSISQIKHYLTNLSNKGFIYYDFGEERITVLDKLKNYLKAKSRKSDYDVISFKSQIPSNNTAMKMQVNSALNIKTKDLNVLGVPEISISDSQRVYMYPKNGRIVIKKNRDFIFSGAITAGNGRFNLFGKDFYFHYDSFWVDLNMIDSVQLSVPVTPIKRDMYGNEILTKVRTVIEAVTGDLQIDHPRNKSGLKKDSFPGYPIFRSYEDSYVYYDRKNIYDGIYNRSQVSFHLMPFEIDSLENYTGKGLIFPGTFRSADIFPVFNDTLRLQSDYSLGFKRKTAKDGFDIYNGKARYYDQIELSNKGIKGSGELHYLTSKSISNEIIFFPDSVNMDITEFELLKVMKGIEFPDASNSNAYVHFEPYNDIMNIKKKDYDFRFYNNEVLLSGNIILRPTGLIGSGIMKLDKAKVSSNYFKYNAIFFNADTADLVVNASEIGGIAFRSNNLRTYIDLGERIGLFYSNGADSYVDLPENEYICYIDKLRWDMELDQLNLGENEDNSSGTRFISTNPLQDSISFLAKTASYNLNDYVIYASGVDSVLVADAIIYPDSSKLVVEKSAIIRTLDNATVIANSLTQYHTFKKSSINIKGKYNYTGKGEYTYKDKFNKDQTIFLQEISVNEDLMTVATGFVKDDNPFNLGSRFKFKGNVNLSADDKYLTFDGFFKIDHKCSFIPVEWIRFTSEIAPDNIIFELDSFVINDDDERLTAGLVMNVDSSNIYSTFLNKKRRNIDIDLLTASYFLYYDKDETAFVVSGYDSLSNVFRLYDKECLVNGDGILDLGISLGRIGVETAGFIEHNILSEDVDIRVFLLLDFFFSEKALKIMAEDIFLSPGIDNYDFTSDFYGKTLARIIGEEKATELLIDLEMSGEFMDFPDELNSTMVFTNLDLRWDKKDKSFYSVGGIGLGNMGEYQINSILKDSYIKIKKGRSNDVLTIYLVTDAYESYYFNYKSGIMRVRSTNPAFNEVVQELNEKKRKAPNKGGLPAFRYQIAPEQMVDRFLKEMEKK